MTDSYSYEQGIALQCLCASEPVEVFAFCHHANEMGIGGAALGWFC